MSRDAAGRRDARGLLRQRQADDRHEQLCERHSRRSGRGAVVRIRRRWRAARLAFRAAHDDCARQALPDLRSRRARRHRRRRARRQPAVWTTSRAAPASTTSSRAAAPTTWCRVPIPTRSISPASRARARSAHCTSSAPISPRTRCSRTSTRRRCHRPCSAPLRRATRRRARRYRPPSKRSTPSSPIPRPITSSRSGRSGEIHDIGGGYIVTGTGMVAKLSPSGAVQWQTRTALGGQDIEEYYDAAGKRRGYVIAGSPDGEPSNSAGSRRPSPTS